MKENILFIVVLFLVIPSIACSQVKNQTIEIVKPIAKKLPVIKEGNFKEESFVAPDGSFQINLPAHNLESVQDLDSNDVKLDGAGMRYVWSSDKIQISVKSVYSEHFPYSDSQSGKEKYWQENTEQIKNYEIQEGSKIVEERDLSSDNYFGKELKEITPRKNISFSRYYYSGTRFVSVIVLVTDNNLEIDARKYLNSFKLLK